MLKDLQEEILRLKKSSHAAVLAHSYQSAEILEVADLTGDSFALSVKARELETDTLILCGVRFMAETLKLLCPEKKVLLPVPEATCPMAEQIQPERVRAFREAHPDYKIVAYINTTAALKAECDVCVTSSGALKIVASLPEKNILFIPDKNLGAYVQARLPEKNIILWEGCCPVHNAVSEEEIQAAKAAHPGAKVLLHPELPAEVVRHGDVVGSTAEILHYAQSTTEDCIIGTEKSIADYLSLTRPFQQFHLLSKKLICPDMRITGLRDLLRTLEGQGGEEIQMDPGFAKSALRPIEEMIRLG